jgi:DNA-binding NarL/FixJ family response regulator
MAMQSVLSGKSYLSPGISELVIDGYLEGRRTLKPHSSWETLTAREREVLKLIAEGRRTKEIAEYLCISAKTAEKHRSNLMKKLNLHGTSALTAFAIQKGLVEK